MPDSDHRFGKLIHSEEDDLGEIHVYERDGMRILTFGNPVEQSCMHLASPWQLEHEYTRGMMLGLLLNADSRSALVLGLGGGMPLPPGLSGFGKKKCSSAQTGKVSSVLNPLLLHPFHKLLIDFHSIFKISTDWRYDD